MGALEFRKVEVKARNGLVTASTPSACEAGVKLLREGGNAIDAGVALGFCNTVVEPYLAALAGLGFMLIYSKEDDRVVSLDFNTRSPKAATADMFKVKGEAAAGGTKIFEVEGNENSIGAKAITIPATLKGLCLAHELYGSKPLADVLSPAISLASSGFALGWDQSLVLLSLSRERNVTSEIEEIWYPGGIPAIPGNKIVQPSLGRLLKRVSNEGPGFVYNGDLAKQIVDEMSRGGGILNLEDLASYEPLVSDPVRISYRGYDITTTSTPSGGITVLEAFNILEGFDLSSLSHNSAEYLHIVIEASRHAFADRYSYLGDWESASVPLKGLLSKDYSKEIAALIDTDKAKFPIDGAEPWTAYLGNPIHNPWKYDNNQKPKPSSSSGLSGETTHFNAVDKAGNAVCCTHTPGFHAGISPMGSGLYLTAAMGWFIPKPGYPNSIGPWKRPLMNMAPLMVLKDGVPVIMEGAPGSRRIINRNLQVVLNILEFGMGPQDAISAPTVDVSGLDTLLDLRIGGDVAEDLRRRGHRIKVVEEGPGVSAFSRPSAIYIDRERGVFRGGVDLFRRSLSLGY